MNVLYGIGVSAGLAHGTLRFLQRAALCPTKRTVADPEAEIARFEAARGTAIAQLGQLYDETATALGQSGAVLFHIHQMLLEDPDYHKPVSALIRQERVNADYAVEQVSQHFSALFARMEDDYMRARAADVVDISRRVIAILTDAEGDSLSTLGPCILAADDLLPSETARLAHSCVLAFVTASGSPSSHTAIFARTMGIPAVVGLGAGLAALEDGMEIVVNGESGAVFLSPDITPSTLKAPC